MNLFALFRWNGKARSRVAALRSRRAATPLSGRAARTPTNEPGPAALSSAAQRWLKELPPKLRPFELCRSFPRVANRIALCWNDLALVDTVFNELLVDRRGGREGFPSPVAAELLRLHAWCERRAAIAQPPSR
jgi:hypothetical protein